MQSSNRKEQFSRAWLAAIAATAGVASAIPCPDEDSIDVTLSLRGGSGAIRSPKLDVQLKGTEHDLPANDFKFVLSKKNYDDLRADDVAVPRILVVVMVPGDIADWLTHRPDEMALRRCGWWMSLKGALASSSLQSVTVTVPAANVLTAPVLFGIMGRISGGQFP